MDGRAGFGTPRSLLLPEGHAVGALIHGGVGLMGTHQDPLQGAVVSAVAVVCALRNGALDALVGIAAHGILPPSFDFSGSFPQKSENIHLLIDFFAAYRYNRRGKKSKRNIRFKRKENCHDL